MTRRSPHVPIRLELDPTLHHALESARPGRLERALESAVSGELIRLGIPGAPTVAVEAARSRRPITIYVADGTQRFPQSLLASVWSVVAPAELRSLPGAGVQRDPSRMEKWLVSHAAGLAADAEAQWDAVVASLVQLTIEALRLRPASLLGPEQVMAFASGVSPPPALGTDDLGHVLRGLLELGVSLADRPLVSHAIAQETTLGQLPDDIVESVYMRLRSRDIELRLHAEDLERLLSAPAEARHSVYGEGLGGWSDDFLQLERQLFHDIGLRLPEIVLARADDVRPGTVEVRLGGRPRLPVQLSAADAPSDVEEIRRAIVEALHVAVVREADRLVGIEDVEVHLGSLRQHFPELVRTALAAFSVGDLTRIARGLLRESLTFRDLRTILDRLLGYEEILVYDWDDRALDPRPSANGDRQASQLEFARASVTGLLLHRHMRAGALPAIRVETELEGRLAGLENGARRLTEKQQETIRGSIAGMVTRLARQNVYPVVITAGPARARLREITLDELPALPVVARSEVPPEYELEEVGVVRLA